MSVVWGGSYGSLRPFSGVARWSLAIRRLATLGLAALPSVGRRQVELSEWRGVLETLRSLHVVDALPVPLGASQIGQGVRPQAAAMPPRPLAVDRAPVHDPTSSVRVAAQHAARSTPT